MEFITPYTVGTGIAVYFFLTLFLFGFNLAQYLLLISAVWFGMCITAEAVAIKLQLGGQENVVWFALGFCCCVLAGGVIFRGWKVFEKFKERKNET